MGAKNDKGKNANKFLSAFKHHRERVRGLFAGKKRQAPNFASSTDTSGPATRKSWPSIIRSALLNLSFSQLIDNLGALKLKTKIRLALVLLFAAITMLGIIGGEYVQRASNNTILMLRDNYTTIEYTMKMSQSVNDVLGIITMKETAESYRRQELRKAFDNFEVYQKMQADKATDSKEQEIIAQLQKDYEDFKTHALLLQSPEEVDINIYMKRLNILELLKSIQEQNSRIIKQRTIDASNIANKVTLYMIILGFFFFIFAVLALFYFPNYIADPIHTLTESIQQIAQKNYSQRLDINYGDEFGEMARSFNLMAEKLEEYENINVAQVLAEKKRTETIVSRMNEAIIGLDDQKHILFVNPPALDLIGLREKDLIGKSAENLGKKNELLFSLIKEILNGEVVNSKSLAAISIDKNGKRQYFNKDLLRIESQGEEAHSRTSVGYVIILKNITELKEQDIAKTNFMATLSHELKTPISAIDMSLNLMKDRRIGHLNLEQKDLARTISQNTSRLLKMVNEILDISRIETGQLQLQFEYIPPREIVTRSLENVKTFIAEKNLQIMEYIEPDLPQVKVDLHKTTAVLVNILTNAVRYSHEGDSIQIVVVKQENTIEFSVKDHGPGISEEEQKKLFQPYRRAHGDKTKGTGLGLAISKEFVEAQGGKIWVLSKSGSGSTFCFTLPFSS